MVVKLADFFEAARACMFYNLAVNNVVRHEFTPIGIVVKTNLVFSCDFSSFNCIHTGFLCNHPSCVSYTDLFYSIRSAPTTFSPFYILKQDEMRMACCGPIRFTASCRRCLPYSSIFVLMVLLLSSNTHPMNPIINCNGKK